MNMDDKKGKNKMSSHDGLEENVYVRTRNPI